MWVLEILINGIWQEIERSKQRRPLDRRAANIHEFEARVRKIE